ncbi:MAG: acetate--CoA ligase family protein [Proteobacteria bacterium]|nr:acetate--CoA ligase family protein [Pseudomonadota bacterium]
MLSKSDRHIIEASKSRGWILEPQAKQIMAGRGFDIPNFVLTDSIAVAGTFLRNAPGPVVAKAVSEKIIHKTEFAAVVTGISEEKILEREMIRLKALQGCEQVLVEEMVKGLEIIIGAKNDFQFGPVVVLGLGGTSVEIYKDTAIRMAPVKSAEVASMVDSLQGKRLFRGYRRSPGVNMAALGQLVANFSSLIMDLEENFQSIDLNPVICTQDRCVIADARIMLVKGP